MLMQLVPELVLVGVLQQELVGVLEQVEVPGQVAVLVQVDVLVGDRELR